MEFQCEANSALSLVMAPAKGVQLKVSPTLSSCAMQDPLRVVWGGSLSSDIDLPLSNLIR